MNSRFTTLAAPLLTALPARALQKLTCSKTRLHGPGQLSTLRRRTSGRVIFATCAHWNKDAPALNAALPGPVTIQATRNGTTP